MHQKTDLDAQRRQRKAARDRRTFDCWTQVLDMSPETSKPLTHLWEVPRLMNTRREHGTPNHANPPGFKRKQWLIA